MAISCVMGLPGQMESPKCAPHDAPQLVEELPPHRTVQTEARPFLDDEVFAEELPFSKAHLNAVSTTMVTQMYINHINGEHLLADNVMFTINTRIRLGLLPMPAHILKTYIILKRERTKS